MTSANRSKACCRTASSEHCNSRFYKTKTIYSSFCASHDIFGSSYFILFVGTHQFRKGSVSISKIGLARIVDRKATTHPRGSHSSYIYSFLACTVYFVAEGWLFVVAIETRKLHPYFLIKRTIPNPFDVGAQSFWSSFDPMGCQAR